MQINQRYLDERLIIFARFYRFDEGTLAVAASFRSNVLLSSRVCFPTRPSRLRLMEVGFGVSIASQMIFLRMYGQGLAVNLIGLISVGKFYTLCVTG